MPNSTCWYCFKDFVYEEPQYRDVNCPYCAVMNSIYNPDKPDRKPEVQPTTENEWLNKEEKVINYNDEKYQGKFIYLPVMGQTAEFDIEEISEVKSDNPKFNFSEDVPVMIGGEQAIDDEGEILTKKKDLGYHIEARLKNGKVLSVTSMSAFKQVFKKFNIQDGDKILVNHKEKGVWEVKKL
jgi:phage FluMu protein Com